MVATFGVDRRKSRRRARYAALCVLSALATIGVRPARSSAKHAVPLPTVTISHLHPELAPTSLLRVRRGWDVLVRIDDANPLIYSYDVSGVAIPSDPSLSTFLNLFGPQQLQAASGAAPSDMTKAPPPELNNVLQSTLAFSSSLASLIEYSDEGHDTAIATQQYVRSETNLAAIAAGLVDHLDSADALRAYLEAVYQKADAAAQQSEHARYDRCMAAADAICSTYHGLTHISLGTTTRRVHLEGSASERVVLHVTNRLGDAYAPRRLVGDVTVAEIIPEERPIVFSVGVTAIAGRRRAFELQRVSQATEPDTFTIVSHRNSSLTLLPSVQMTATWPISPTAGLGGTIGFGIRGDAGERITNGSDLMLGLTIRYYWLNVTLGSAYAALVEDVGGLVSGDRTTDANILTRTSIGREWRFAVTLHAAL